MADFDEIPDWYGEEEEEEAEFFGDEFDPPKRSKSQPLTKKPVAKKGKKKTASLPAEPKAPSKATNITFPEIMETLESVFGYKTFRGDIQENAIKTLCMEEEDVFVCLPTGGGKSLIYQLPALLYPGITVVVSPLIALIQDQLKGLLERDIKAETINSKLSTEERKAIMDDLYSGEPKTKLLYVTPEQVQTAR